MEAQSNFYWWCCACSYSAICVYKAVLVLDIALAIGLTLNGLLCVIISYTSYQGYVWLLLGLYYCFLAFFAFPLLTGFINNLTSGTLQQQTDKYLKARIYGVYGYFAAAILIPVLFVLYILLVEDGKTTTRNTSNGTTVSYSVIDKPAVFTFAAFLLISLLFNAWFELNLQKSLQEANSVIGGSTNEQAKAQIL